MICNEVNSPVVPQNGVLNNIPSLLSMTNAPDYDGTNYHNRHIIHRFFATIVVGKVVDNASTIIHQIPRILMMPGGTGKGGNIRKRG